MATPRHQKAKLLGAWKLVSLEHGGKKSFTSQTHLVVRDQVLWEVWPDRIAYDDEPSPQHRYHLTWTAQGSMLDIEYSDRTNQRALLRLDGDQLRLRWNSVAGVFPESFEASEGSLATFKRVRSATQAARLVVPPAVRTKPVRTHPQLGTLRFDVSLGWWEGRVTSGDWAGFKLTVDGPLDLLEAALDRAAALLARVRIAEARAHAAADLLELARDWSDGDGSDLTLARFAAQLEPDSFGVTDTGVAIFFHDGGLFHGHGVLVSLDDDLKYDQAKMC